MIVYFMICKGLADNSDIIIKFYCKFRIAFVKFIKFFITNKISLISLFKPCFGFIQ